MKISEIIDTINDHDELAANLIDGQVVIEKVDERPIGNELIGDYICRIVGRYVMSHLKALSFDDATSSATYEVV